MSEVGGKTEVNIVKVAEVVVGGGGWWWWRWGGETVSKEAYNYISYSGVKREILIWGRGVEGRRDSASINSGSGGEGSRGEWASYNYYSHLPECAPPGGGFAVFLFVCLFVSSGEWGGG